MYPPSNRKESEEEGERETVRASSKIGIVAEKKGVESGGYLFKEEKE